MVPRRLVNLIRITCSAAMVAGPAAMFVASCGGAEALPKVDATTTPSGFEAGTDTPDPGQADVAPEVAATEARETRDGGTSDGEDGNTTVDVDRDVWVDGSVDGNGRQEVDSSADGEMSQDAPIFPPPPDDAIDSASVPESLDGAIDSAPFLPTGPTACTITAVITEQPTPRWDGPPATHEFQAVIDWAANTLTTGGNGTVTRVSLVQNNGTWTTTGSVALELGYFTFPNLDYSQMQLRPTAGGCTGNASGTYSYTELDVIQRREFTAVLAGTLDETGPQLSLAPEGEQHPLLFKAVLANEVMPPGTTAELVGPGGITVPLTALPAGGTLGVSEFSLVEKALAFASTYTVHVLPAVMDLAGNQTATRPTLRTLADPGILAEDGFEGPVKAYLEGADIAVVDSTTFAIPAGSRAVAIQPDPRPEAVDSCERLTARMAVKPGAKSLKLSYLTFAPKPYSTSYSNYYWLTIAVPNGEAIQSFLDQAKATILPNPWTGDPPGSLDHVYGAVNEVELSLPAGAGAEVLVDILRLCGHPSTPSTGLIVDDLRIE